MKKKKTYGHDEINSNMSTPLAIIVNNSMQTRKKYQLNSNFVKIIPIYRAKDKTLLNNYRRVSLCPCFTNKFEKLIYMSVYYFLSQNNILY